MGGCPMNGAHLCSVCNLIHETVPACVGCGDYFERQTWWYLAGQDHGQGLAEIRLQAEREHYQREIIRLGGEISARVVKTSEGPTFPQLCDIRGESKRAANHKSRHAQIVDRLWSVGSAV